MADLINGLGGPTGFGENVLARSNNGHIDLTGENVPDGVEGGTFFTDLAPRTDYPPLTDDDNDETLEDSERFDDTELFDNGIDFFGETYNGIIINTNGGVTFREPSQSSFPSPIRAGRDNPGIFPFLSDVDTRINADTREELAGPDGRKNGTPVEMLPQGLEPTAGGTSTGSNLVYYDLDIPNDRLVVTWDDVGFYDRSTVDIRNPSDEEEVLEEGQPDKLNAFQLILENLPENDDSGSSADDFAIEFRYEAINWAETDNDVAARAGWAGPRRNADSFVELEASGDPAALQSLPTTAGNTGEPGRWRWEIRDGEVQGNPPESSDAALAAISGDPHLTTIDGVDYDFHAAGEFVLVRDRDDPDFAVQVRTAPVADNATQNVAMATRVDGHRVMLDATADQPLRVDGRVVELGDSATRALGDGAIGRDGDTFTLAYPGADGTLNAGDDRVQVTLYDGRLDIGVRISEARRGRLEGLLGDGDGNPADDVATADGEVLPRPFAFDDLYGAFRADWRVTSREQSLFDYAEGEGPDSFYQPDVPQGPVGLDTLDPDARADAEAAAQDAGLAPGSAAYRDAVLDLALTGDRSFLDSATTMSQRKPAVEVATREPIPESLDPVPSANAEAFLEPGGGMAFSQPARVFGTDSSGEHVHLDAAAHGVRLDANVDRLDIARPFAELTFRVTEDGLVMADGASPVAILPSLNQALELRFAEGRASLEQTGAQRFALSGEAGGRVTIDADGVADTQAVAVGGPAAAAPDDGGRAGPAGTVFLNPDQEVTVADPVRVMGRSDGSEALILAQDASGVRADANIEDVAIPARLLDLDIGVTDDGLRIADGGSVLLHIPSLNQPTAVEFDDGWATLAQTGAQTFTIAGGDGGRVRIGGETGDLGDVELSDTPVSAAVGTASSDDML